MGDLVREADGTIDIDAWRDRKRKEGCLESETRRGREKLPQFCNMLLGIFGFSIRLKHFCIQVALLQASGRYFFGQAVAGARGPRGSPVHVVPGGRQCT